MDGDARGPLPGKPLGRKAYFSIPHLPGSRTGPADWYLKEHQADLLTVAARDNQRHRDRVVVTEKVDGSCVAVARVGDDVLALNRAGYDAATSPHAVHRGFARWVAARSGLFRERLAPGERVPGEWLQIAHGTRYDILADDDLFVPFDMIVPGRDRGQERRLPHDAQRERFAAMGLKGANVLWDGGAVALADVLAKLGERGAHGAVDEAEGVVYRMETNGAFNFLAKFVRPGKVDGRFLKGLASNDVEEDVYNGPAALRWAA